MTDPYSIPLPPSPLPDPYSASYYPTSPPSTVSALASASTSSHRASPHISPKTARPPLDRAGTSRTLRAASPSPAHGSSRSPRSPASPLDDADTPTAVLRPDPLRSLSTYGPGLSASLYGAGRNKTPDPFAEGTTITINQPVGSLSISPSSRDVCLASRKGLYILDLENLESAPRFIPQGGTWQIADCQWSPHPATSHLILSTSSQKLLVWDLAAGVALHRSIDAHARAITDINWHAINPNLVATVAMDAGIRGWDIRVKDDSPIVRLCAWGAAGTQVKWNRKHEHILATSHGKEVIIWDARKGSVPVTTIKAHDAKIYGIDWDRRDRHRLVTCSLDRTIKCWTIPELASQADSASSAFYETLPAPDAPSAVIPTTYPVWRARNTPFGRGVLALPQRGETALELFTHAGQRIETFEGHDDVVKEFVWRARGGDDLECDDREFQLVTWSKDRTLRVWPVSQGTAERAGWVRGAKIDVHVSRHGAANVTYTAVPDAAAKSVGVGQSHNQRPGAVAVPVSAPSGIARARPRLAPETGMTRGGGTGQRAIDQLEWLTKVVKNRATSGSTTSAPSRADSHSRAASRASDAMGLSTGLGGVLAGAGMMSLKDEVVHVHRLYPKPKVNFEKVDLTQRKVTISLNGPWAVNDRLAFIRIHWSFPPAYPYGPEPPVFELERNATVQPHTRVKMIMAIKELRAANRQCLASSCGYLLGYQERPGRRLIAESDDESEVVQVPMMARTCGATFGPNGQLVCFFPKQTVLPRARASLSRSPSITRDPTANPLYRAITALSRLENPRKAPLRLNRRHAHVRRPGAELVGAPAVLAGSTVTIHAVPNGPDAQLARAYTTSVASNLQAAVDAGRHDHAAIWATLRGLLAEASPAAASHPLLDRRIDYRRDRLAFEKAMARKRRVLDTVFTTLMATHDVQLLALVAAVLHDYAQAAPPLPSPETAIRDSPDTDYFALPRVAEAANSALVRRSSLTISPGTSYRTSGWSQILGNASSISLRSIALTPKDRTSFDLNRSSLTSLGLSYDDPAAGVGSQPSASALGMRIPGATASGTAVSPGPPGLSPRKPSDSPRRPMAATLSTSPQALATGTAPLPTPATSGSKVSFGSASPLRRHFVRTERERRRRVQACSVKVELMADDSLPALIRPDLAQLADMWKLAYADYLLRLDLLGRRAALLQRHFAPGPSRDGPASGEFAAQQLVLANVCRYCQARVVLGDACPGCQRAREPPLCAVCRLPIKGLSTTCTQCTHTSHAACLRRILVSPASPCPACLCRCLAEHGLSGSFVSARLPPHAVSPTLSRGFLAPTSPFASLRSLEHGRRMTAASGASEDTVTGEEREGLLTRARKGAAEAILGRK